MIKDQSYTRAKNSLIQEMSEVRHCDSRQNGFKSSLSMTEN